ncbi:MAG: hypothetical protein HC804_10675 [Anaerolineae bacterium]|nr:hypothetical protein [Anaerolineae bacterium]
MRTRLKSVVVTAIPADSKDGIPKADIYPGDQAFVLALADYYGLTNTIGLAQDLAALLVHRKNAELEQEKQEAEMWDSYERQGAQHGTEANLPN